MRLDENIVFWSNLEKIKDQLLLSDVELSKSFGLTEKEYFKYKNSVRFLPLTAVFEFTEKMNFHFEDLLNPDFKLNYTPPEQLTRPPLLDRYTLATHSQTRPIINILNYMEHTLGMRAKVNLIRKFQISEDYIKQENNKTNILLISDIVEHLAKTHSFKKTDFIGIGRRMPFLTSNNVLKDKLTHHKKAIDILDSFIYDCTRLFDTNCTYRITEHDDDYAVVEVAPNKNVVDELRVNPNYFGNEQVCLTRMGNISSVTWFKYGQNARIKKISSIHAGDLSNKYLMDLSAFKKFEKEFSSNSFSDKSSFILQ